MTPVAFRSAAEFRAWLERHHATATELDVRLWKAHARSRGLAYAEALDEALCFGWIDGVRRAHDADSFRIRFCPRRKGSRWSLVNVRHAERLVAAGRMSATGLAVFRARDPEDPRRYSFESRPVTLSPAFARKLREDARAWRFFRSQPPWYRRVSQFWVMSAKREETREKRLAHLIERSAAGRSIRLLERSKTKPGGKATRPPKAAARGGKAKAKHGRGGRT